jgi:hypothetical protein
MCGTIARLRRIRGLPIDDPDPVDAAFDTP